MAVAPEGTVRVALFDSSERNEDTAVATAWATWRPGVTLTPAGPVLRQPPRSGWLAEFSASFTASNGTQVRAEARRLGDTTWVMLVEGDDATLAKRESQVDGLIDSLAPPGLEDESFAGKTPRALDAKALDAFLEDARSRLGVPGVAVAIVSRDAVLYEKTLGTKALGGTDAITPRTRFLVGSVTKPMTTLMEASLVDAGKFKWTTPVTELLPSFALGDAELTKQLQLLHMSCACTGMPRRDLEYLFEYANVTPEQRVASMREMKPTTKLGEAFQYSNLMVAAGGFIAAHAAYPTLSMGAAYERAMQERVFGPIGMVDTTSDFTRATTGDVATPHALDLEGALQPVPLEFEGNVVPIAPAGAVWSTLKDLERYAQTELERGVAPGGARVASEAAFAERLEPRIEGATYGLGLDVDRQAGLLVVGHDGGSTGFGTSVYLLPQLGLGLVVLTNVRNGTGAMQLPLNEAVKRKLLELLFEGARPISKVIVQFALDARKVVVGQQTSGVERTPDAAWVSSLAGTYRHPTLGEVTLRGQTFDAGEWRSRFGRKGTSVVLLDVPFAGTPFEVGGDAATPTLAVPDPQQPTVFTRVK